MSITKTVVAGAIAKILSAGMTAFTPFFADAAWSVDDSGNYVKWDLSVTDGYYNDAANWAGGVVPANGQLGKYAYIDKDTTNPQDLTIRIPQGGFSENSGTYFRSLNTAGKSRTITFDVRGTSWEKTGAEYGNASAGFTYGIGTSNPIFQFTGIKTDGTKPVFRMTDVLLRFCSDSKKEDVYLDQGVFDCLNEGEAGFNKIYMGYKQEMDFHVSSNATFIGSTIYLCAPNNFPCDSRIIFEGGSGHKIEQIDLMPSYVGGATGNGAWLIIKGDTNARFKTINAGHKNTQSIYGNVILSNDVNISSYEIYLGSAATNTGTLKMSDNARYSVDKYFRLGNAPMATGIVEMVSRSYLSTDAVRMGSQVSSRGMMTIADNAQISCESLNFGNANYLNGSGFINLSGDAVMTVNGEIANVAKSGSTEESGISIANNAELSVKSIDGNGMTSFVANGGTVTIPSDAAGATLGSFTSATIDSNGLTLNAQADVAVDAAFTGAGALTIAGSGEVSLTKSCLNDKIILSPLAKAKFTADAISMGGVVLGDHSILSVEANVTLAALDAAGSDARIKIADGASLTITDTAAITNVVSFIIDENTTIGDHAVITAGADATLDASKFAVLNLTSGKKFTPSLSGDGKTLSVNVQSVEGATDYTWTGASGNDWNNAANWSPSTGVPSLNDNVIIAAGEQSASIALAEIAVVNSITVQSGDVSLTGAQQLVILGENAITVSGGSLTIANPLALKPAVTVSVQEGAALNLEGEIICYEGKVAFNKVGFGALKVAGDNAILDVDWIIPGGINTFVGGSSLGRDTDSVNGLVLSNNTFRYEGEAAIIRRPINFRKKNTECPAMFDVEGDLTFADFTVEGAPSGYVKTGIGTLKFELADDEQTLVNCGVGASAAKTNMDNELAPAENGMITSWAGLATLTVFEGKLQIIGRGKDSAEVSAPKTCIVGGNYVARATPELVFEDINIRFASGAYPFNIAHKIAEESLPPKLTLIDAYVNVVNDINLNSCTNWNDDVASMLVMTNSTVTKFTMNAAKETGLKKVVLAENSILTAPASNFTRIRNADISIDSGSRIIYPQSSDPSNRFVMDTTKVSLFIGEDAELEVGRFVGDGSSGPGQFEFNGGTLRLDDPNQWSGVDLANRVKLMLGAKGINIKTVENVTHTFAIPFFGEGTVTKTGAGTCAFTTLLQAKHSATGSDATTIPAFHNVGGLVVAEGTAILQAAAIAPTNENFAVTVRSGAALNLNGDTFNLASLNGGGVVSNGTLSTTLFVGAEGYAAPTFDNVTFGAMTVDMGLSEEDNSLRLGDAFVIARFIGAVTPNLTNWKGVRTGKTRKLSFAMNEDNEIVAAVEGASGMVIIIR